MLYVLNVNCAMIYYKYTVIVSSSVLRLLSLVWEM